MFGLFCAQNLIPPTATLNSFSVINSSGICDPTEGLFQATWGATGSLGAAVIDLYYSFDNISFNPIVLGLDPTTPPYAGDISGEPGFTSLSATYFRCSLKIGGVEQSGSPIDLSPPYVC